MWVSKRGDVFLKRDGDDLAVKSGGWLFFVP